MDMKVWLLPRVLTYARKMKMVTSSEPMQEEKLNTGSDLADDSVSGWSYKGPGFHWLKNVEKDENPEPKFSEIGIL